jgi:hypothetical protein
LSRGGAENPMEPNKAAYRTVKVIGALLILEV